MTNADCDPGDLIVNVVPEVDPDSVWLLDGEVTAFDLAEKIVPGDTLTKICTYDITASGDHLTADLDMSTPSYTGSNALTGALTVTPTYKVDATVGQTTITSADDTKVLEVTVVVAFPPEILVEDNTTQDLNAVLDDITITATQDHS